MDQSQTQTPPKTQPALAVPYEKMLRRRAARLPVSTFLDLAGWVLSRRNAESVTQKAFAARHRIPLRQVKTYEAVARWPDEAKEIVRRASSLLVTDLTRQFANRAWTSSSALTEALRAWADGRRHPVTAATDPNIAYLEADLTQLLRAPVKITGNGCSGELHLAFTSPEDLERILVRLRR